MIILDGALTGLEMETTETEVTLPAPETSLMTVEILATAEGEILSSSPALSARVVGTGRNSVGPRRIPSWSVPIGNSSDLRVVPGDFNFDGFDDVAVTDRVALLDWSLRMTVYWGSAAGLSTSGDIVWEGEPYHHATALETADINQDGFPDLLLGQVGLPGSVCAFLSLGSGDFEPGSCVDVGLPSTHYSSPVHILNLHSLDASAGEDVIVRSRLSDPWHTMATEVFVGTNAGLAMASIWTGNGSQFGATGDVTGDGQDDLLQTTWLNPSLSLLASSGGTLASSPLWSVTTDFPSWQVSWLDGSRDLTGDGVHDFVVGRANDDVVLIMAGTPGGAPSTVLELSAPQYASLGARVGSLSDATRDSFPDVWYTERDPPLNGTQWIRLLPGGPEGPSSDYVWSIPAFQVWEVDANGDSTSEILAFSFNLSVFELSPVTFSTLDLGGLLVGSIEETFVGNLTIDDPSGDPGRCVWLWGDGEETIVDPCPAAEPPTHSYAAQGRYTVRVEYTNSVGVASSAIATWLVTH